MLKKFQTYIEQEPWDEELERQEKWLDKFCWVILIASALYLIPICLHSIYEVKHEAQINISEENSKISQLSGNAATDQNGNVYNTTKQRAAQVRRLRGI